MKNRGQQNLGQSACFAFLLLFARFMKNRIPRSGLRMKSLGASGRFSSWLARTDGPVVESPDAPWPPTAAEQRVRAGGPDTTGGTPARRSNSSAQIERESAREPESRANPVSKNGRDALGKTAGHSAVAPAPTAPPHPGSETNSRADHAWYHVPRSARPGSPRAPARDLAGNALHPSG